MKKKLNIAIVGITGLVGETLLEILEQRQFPSAQIFGLASKHSVGKLIEYNQQTIEVSDVANFDFSQADIAFFSAGSEVSKQYAPIAAEQHCVVIDNTSCFRYADNVPLVIPEVNPEDIAQYQETGIIANPNCSTIQMLVALKPLYDAVGISRINVATYQAVSGAGKQALSELIEQTGELLNGRTSKAKAFAKQIAFNVLPHIDVWLDNGYSKEEMKMVWETQKILHDKQIAVNPTCVRVPVCYGHSEAVSIETHLDITAQSAKAILSKAPGIKVLDKLEKNTYPTPITSATGKDAVFVGRIRNGINNDQILNLWIVADNIRKGAALNAIQIAELLYKRYPKFYE